MRQDERKFSEVWASFPVFLEAANRDAGRAELGQCLKGDRRGQDVSAVKGARVDIACEECSECVGMCECMCVHSLHKSPGIKALTL